MPKGETKNTERRWTVTESSGGVLYLDEGDVIGRARLLPGASQFLVMPVEECEERIEALAVEHQASLEEAETNGALAILTTRERLAEAEAQIDEKQEQIKRALAILNRHQRGESGLEFEPAGKVIRPAMEALTLTQPETKDERCPTCLSRNPWFTHCKDPAQAEAETGRTPPPLRDRGLSCDDPWHGTGKAPQEPEETRLGFELAGKAMRTGHTVKATLSLHQGTVEGTVISVEDRYCLLDTSGIGCGDPSMRVYWAELDGFEILPGDDEQASQELPSGSEEEAARVFRLRAHKAESMKAPDEYRGGYFGGKAHGYREAARYLTAAVSGSTNQDQAREESER